MEKAVLIPQCVGVGERAGSASAADASAMSVIPMRAPTSSPAPVPSYLGPVSQQY